MIRRGLLVISVVALLAAACGGSADDAASEPAPTTTVASTTTAAPTTTTTAAPAPIVPGEDPDIDAIVNAYSVAFDSVSDYTAKAIHIDDPSGLEETVAGYLTTGETMGGVAVLVTAVVVDGSEAEVTYDLLFNENPTYPDLSGTAVLTDDGWKVPRPVFCSLMTSARVGCPAE